MGPGGGPGSWLLVTTTAVEPVLIQVAKQGEGVGLAYVRMSAMHASSRQRLPTGTLALPFAAEGNFPPFSTFLGLSFCFCEMGVMVAASQG